MGVYQQNHEYLSYKTPQSVENGGIPTKSRISQLQNATECRKWYQMIARSVYYIQVIR